MASTAAATAYATHTSSSVPTSSTACSGFNERLIRSGHLRHARTRLLMEPPRSTTLSGEGLQHEDGHSLLFASTVPNCKVYDATFAARSPSSSKTASSACSRTTRTSSLHDRREWFLPHARDAGGRRRGRARRPLPLRQEFKKKPAAHVQLFGSGAILNEVIRAQGILEERYSVAADVWSATSYVELRREALSVERWNRLHPGEAPRVPYVTQILKGAKGPIIAAFTT